MSPLYFGGDEESRTPVRTHCPMNLSERRPCSASQSVFVQGQTGPIQPVEFPKRLSGTTARQRVIGIMIDTETELHKKNKDSEAS